MRCSKCGKKKRKKTKKRPKVKILIPVFIVLILSILAFLLFGGDKVPEKIRNLKGYSYLTGVVKEKLPDQIKLPFELPVQVKLPFELPDRFPFDFSFELPFELPNPGNLLGGSGIPDKNKIMEDLAVYEGDGEKSKHAFESLEIEKRTTVEEEKKDTVYVITETSGEEGTTIQYYRLLYKRHLVGGWKLEEVKPYNVKGQKSSVAGVDNDTVIKDKSLFSDISPDWNQSKIKILEHYTDLKTGTDTVVVYMELENDYVNMAGTKEIMYQYNEETGQWEAGPASKLTCLSIEPVSKQQ
ncbi:MAG: hypothetical protein PHC91_07350 [Eubacteriales bacterium]|nr:hypothetical protein [Eubacteriales bacterium]